MLNHIPIAQLMSRNVARIAPEEPLVLAYRRVREEGISCLMVMRGAELAGIITERDLVNHIDYLIDQDNLNLAHLGRVCDVMSRHLVAVMDTDGLQTALDKCMEKAIRHLPVLNAAGDLVGVVTQTDLVRAYSHILAQQLSLASDNERLKALSLLDPLMGIGNRRAMERDLKHTAAGSDRRHLPYGVALLDIDWFKRYNDHYGHQLGDEALKAVATAIGRTLRAGDRLYRYGGEELMLLLPETDLEGAVSAAERARNAVLALSIEHDKSPLGVLSLSAGAAAGADRDWQALVSAADEALYDAKHNGRNCVHAMAAHD
ncbi:response regulator receiver modulated diguanylate cyclase [Simiduia agarivorans SA1 = DSM 21679]|uniref:diguanylate cyclase n=2 Tax=Simiduia TaxID=447467 RepID=K4KQP3_SIMAS|nr:response regulator receiver modulated diguanylate cyclase [Simiduia agarivorans SA1 = DSM 21679]